MSAMWFFSRFCGVELRSEDIVSPRVDVTFLSNFKLRPYAVRTFFNYFFSTSAPSRPNLLSITGIKMMVSRSSQSSESVSGYSTKFYMGRLRPEGPTTYLFINQFWPKRCPFRRPSIDKWYPFHDLF